jgi:hypothetical protein
MKAQATTAFLGDDIIKLKQKLTHFALSIHYLRGGVCDDGVIHTVMMCCIGCGVVDNSGCDGGDSWVR